MRCDTKRIISRNEQQPSGFDLNQKPHKMTKDIRDKSHITHEDILALNFIREPGAYVFRKYHKQGLRSHIMEILDPEDVLKQNKGEVIDGVRIFSWAKPLKILRIFRTKFSSIKEVFEEIRKFKIVEKYLPDDFYAKSDEFVVDYIWNQNRDFILCGLQEYVEGEVLNPWDPISKHQLAGLFALPDNHGNKEFQMTSEQLIHKFQKKIEHFIVCVKKMILKANYVPDFAGVENLLVTSTGNIKLVDINNISKVFFGPEISLDDKGYPVCDKSIEAISMIEKNMLGKSIDKTERLYKIFLDPQRMKEVDALEEKFHLSARSKLIYS